MKARFALVLIISLLFLVCCPINIFTNKQFLIKHTEGVWGRNFPMFGGCSAERLRGACPHRESVVSHQNNKLYLSDTTLGMTEGEAHRSAWFDFLGKTFNFIILFGFLFLLIRKPLVNFLKGRGNKIKDKIESSERLKKEAEERLMSIEERLERIAEEIDGMKKKAEEEGMEEKKKLLKEAEAEREKIIRSVKKEIETHAKKAMKELKEYGSQLSITLAEEKMKKTLDKDKQKKIIVEVLKDLEEIE